MSGDGTAAGPAFFAVGDGGRERDADQRGRTQDSKQQIHHLSFRMNPAKLERMSKP
jgi:hypothetical protein